MAATDRRGTGGRKDVNDPTESSSFGNSKIMSLDSLTGREAVSLDVGTCVLPFVGLKRPMRY